MAATPTSSEAAAGQAEAEEHAGHAGDEHDRGATRPAVDGVAGRLREPAIGGHDLLDAVVEAVHGLGELGHVLGVDGADGATQRLELVEGVGLGAAQRLAAVARQAGVALVGHGDVDGRAPGRSPSSERKLISPRAARSTMAVVSACRLARPSMMTAAAAGDMPGGGAGMRMESSSR